MSKVTRFTAADPGSAARISGFIAHLRSHGFRIGVAETETALLALSCVNPIVPTEACLALKSVCSGSSEEAAQFDLLFQSFWMSEGRVHHKTVPIQRTKPPKNTRSSRTNDGQSTTGNGTVQASEDENDREESYADGTGKLMASTVHNLMKKDLREIVTPEDICASEKVAIQLGKALKNRRSRRRKVAKKGSSIDLRRTMRLSLSTGGEPLLLARTRKPDRPIKIVALCDVSGSMMNYARPFLAFLVGLMRADDASDAYLFHTRLVRITNALRDNDPLRALNRITLLADGFGGGSKIGANLRQFSNSYARNFVDGRSIVFILSDGYDSGSSEVLGPALAKIKQRGCKIVWLNPLKGWRGYEPVAKGMAAAMPYLDAFVAANTLTDLANLDHTLERL